jgi:hypothetical protein
VVAFDRITQVVPAPVEPQPVPELEAPPVVPVVPVVDEKPDELYKNLLLSGLLNLSES